MNFNWKAAIIAFAVTFVTIDFGLESNSVPLTFAGLVIGGLIAGYMVRSYKEGILNGTFPVSLAITALVIIDYINKSHSFMSVIDYIFGIVALIFFPMSFILSLIGPTIGVTIKKIKNKILKDYNKYYNSNGNVIDESAADSTHAEKQVSKFKNMDVGEVIFICIVIVIIFGGTILWISILWLFFHPQINS